MIKLDKLTIGWFPSFVILLFSPYYRYLNTVVPSYYLRPELLRTREGEWEGRRALFNKTKTGAKNETFSNDPSADNRLPTPLPADRINPTNFHLPADKGDLHSPHDLPTPLPLASPTNPRQTLSQYS